jgi:cell wall-associated NlpC family hydrolase
MVRPLNILGMGLIILLLWFGFYQRGWTEERYTVKPGDTLYGISRSMGVSIEALKKANDLEVESIKPRQVLTIPSRAGKKAAEVSGRSPSRASKKLSGGVVKRTTGEMDSYVVQKGDSLYNISKRVGFSTEEIIKRNGLPTSALKIGQILLLPRDGSRSDEEAEELGDEEETVGTSQGEGEKGEPVSPPLGKWSNLEERSLLVRVVKTFLGVPYKLGGSTLKGIDCSALVKKVYEIFNIQLPRTAREQFAAGKRVAKDQLEEGDLVFFRRRGNSAHVGIYVGDNQFVHASSYSREVRVDYLNTPYYSQRFLRGVRVKELDREI